MKILLTITIIIVSLIAITFFMFMFSAFTLNRDYEDYLQDLEEANKKLDDPKN